MSLISKAFQPDSILARDRERQSADQADFTCLLGVDFDDSDHAAAHGVARFLVEV